MHTSSGLFCPSHDMALANGVRHFNPPAAAVRLAADLAGIERWWQDGEGAAPVPWGWNWDVREALAREWGVARSELPTDADLDALRRLSSRATAAAVVAGLADLSPGVAVPSVVTTEAGLSAVVDGYATRGDAFVMKAPWSSSGRGNSRYRIADAATADAAMRRGRSLLRRQGSVVVEPWYGDKLADFAMLFRVRHNEVVWVGYSVFTTDERGTYRCGLLDSNDALAGVASGANEATAATLCELRRRYVADIMPRLFAPLMGRPWEVGYVGVDMMRLERGLHPCVEMNVRTTMGVVARRMYDLGATDGRRGTLTICPDAEGHFRATVSCG